jgi:hypothetical protein
MDFPGWEKDMTRSDIPLLKHFIEIHNSADMVVTWFGKGFDYKWLQSKAFEYNLPYLAPVPHVDLCYTAKAHFKAGGNSLKNISELGGFTGKKTPVDSYNWRRAAVGYAPAIRKVIAHCKADIEMTTEAYERMRPLVRQHPRVNGVGPCRFCGSDRMQKRGLSLTKLKNQQQRVQCVACHSWDLRALGEFIPGADKEYRTIYPKRKAA